MRDIPLRYSARVTTETLKLKRTRFTFEQASAIEKRVRRAIRAAFKVLCPYCNRHKDPVAYIAVDSMMDVLADLRRNIVVVDLLDAYGEPVDKSCDCQQDAMCEIEYHPNIRVRSFDVTGLDCMPVDYKEYVGNPCFGIPHLAACVFGDVDNTRKIGRDELAALQGVTRELSDIRQEMGVVDASSRLDKLEADIRALKELWMKSKLV